MFTGTVTEFMTARDLIMSNRNMTLEFFDASAHHTAGGAPAAGAGLGTFWERAASLSRGEAHKRRGLGREERSASEAIQLAAPMAVGVASIPK